MSKKLTSGEGWRIIPAEPIEEIKEIVSKPRENQKIKISIEKRNKGKVVTLISNLVLSEKDLNDLAKSIKTSCGTGGTVNNGNIEIQGNNIDKVKAWFISNNWGLK
ncbi:MAG: translation initiation factor [Candidatus Sericytochromatia bacterium]